ncbi:endonuclease domain-containing protein [Streptomyces sp. NPDC090798]|uniref:endonuclease domain-containing protein n=1 Tax=Streptomyces sp. NPDC090798 TaxID=3365968 RepID=UPI0037F5607E
MPYELSRRRNTRADAYLCSLCKESPASAWDHCHGHGFVRGPFCGSRNTHEARASPDWFLRHEDNVLHLLERLNCREQRTDGLSPNRHDSGRARRRFGDWT